MTTVPTVEQIDAFAANLQDWLQAKWRAAGNVGRPEKIRVEYGTKYARLVRYEEGVELSGSAYGFIDRLNGDLLKADGWKKPAKHARGSIFNENPLTGCGPYGMAYRR
jgi:hypothetical protein